MKLSLTLHGHHGSYTKEVSLRHLISGFVLVSIVFLISSRSTHSLLEDYARVQVAQANLDKQEQVLVDVREKTRSQLGTYADQIATLRHQLAMVNQNQQLLADTLDVSGIVSAYPIQSVIDFSDPNNILNDPIIDQIKAMQNDVELKQNQLNVLEKLVSGHHVEHQVALSGRPIRKGWLSSYFGMRDDPFTGEPTLHRGVDFAGKSGADVIATGAGLVTWSGERYGYGRMIEINHGDGIVTRYGHNESLLVKVGDVVTKGQAISTMGNTGRSTGAHVHYEVLKHGKKVDPLAYLR